MVCSGDNPGKENQREEEENQQEKKVSWTAYHANLQPHTESSQARVTQTSLLPLFHDQAHSAAMTRHSMDVVKKAIEILNHGQVPVIAMDQPLYALAKHIQWNWNTSHGENQFVLMFGGLHIEMAALKALGTLLDRSGWTGALVDGQVHIASSGTADSFLHASHVTRTRRTHQITGKFTVYPSQESFSGVSRQPEDENAQLSFEDWCSNKSVHHPQFKF